MSVTDIWNKVMFQINGGKFKWFQEISSKTPRVPGQKMKEELQRSNLDTVGGEKELN